MSTQFQNSILPYLANPDEEEGTKRQRELIVRDNACVDMLYDLIHYVGLRTFEEEILPRARALCALR